MTRREPMGVEPHSSRARCDAPYRRTASHGAQTENNNRQQTIRIKDMRQGLHTLVQTQGLDGLQHLFNRLAPRGRVLLFCLLCAEAGWTTLVITWLLLERAYLKSVNRSNQWDVPYAPSASLPSRSKAMRLRQTGTFSVFYCFNFLTQRGLILR